MLNDSQLEQATEAALAEMERQFADDRAWIQGAYREERWFDESGERADLLVLQQTGEKIICDSA